MDEITNSNKYCNIQESCKLLIQANNQYGKVVQQNRSLQKELRAKGKKIGRLKKQNLHLAQCKGDVYTDYVYADNRAIEFEELGWERQELIEKYKNAFDEIKKLSEELEDYLQGLHYEWALNKQIQEILQEFEVKDESKTHKTSD